MKSLSATAKTEIAKQHGTEPILLVQVQWSSGTIYYSDREVTISGLTIEKRIQDITNLNIAQTLDQIRTSGAISLTLDDLDGQIKSKFDSVVLEGVVANVYLAYPSFTSSDLIPLLRGKITGPISWDEGTRSFSCDVVSNLESDQVPWPLVFGQVINAPTKKSVTTARGRLLTRIHSGTSDTATIQIENGDKFPQNTTLKIGVKAGGGVVIIEGSFSGTAFTVGGSGKFNMPIYENISLAARPGGDVDENNARVIWIDDSSKDLRGQYVHIDSRPSGSTFNIPQTNYCIRQEGAKCWFRNEWERTIGANRKHEPALLDETYTIATTRYKRDGVYKKIYKFGPEMTWDYEQEVPIWYLFESAPVWEVEKNETFIVSQAAATVKDVRAFRTINGERALLSVPSEYYTINSGPPVTISFSRPLDFYKGWEGDPIYTVVDGLSANTGDTLEHIIDNYTNLSKDASEFSTYNTDIDKYPNNFATSEDKDAITLLQEIAFQARTALTITGLKARPTYLSKEPSSGDFTLDKSSMLLDSLKLGFTNREDIYTKVIGEWKKHTLQDEPEEETYEANVSQFGFNERRINFYIYNIESLVQKSVDFWGKRFSNMWRRINVDVPLTALELELFDYVKFNPNDEQIFPTENLLCSIDEINQTVTDKKLGLSCWMPVVAGSTSQSSVAYQDDSGDTKPGDPTNNITAATVDSYGGINPEPNRRDLVGTSTLVPGDQQGSGFLSPAKVIEVLGSGDYAIDLYEDGLGGSVTESGITASQIGSEDFQVNDEVMAFRINETWYIQGTALSLSVLRGQIASKVPLTVDIFEDGYGSSPTQVSVPAIQLDPETDNLSHDDKVVIYKIGDSYRIDNINVSEDDFNVGSSTPTKITNGTDTMNADDPFGIVEKLSTKYLTLNVHRIAIKDGSQSGILSALINVFSNTAVTDWIYNSSEDKWYPKGVYG